MKTHFTVFLFLERFLFSSGNQFFYFIKLPKLLQKRLLRDGFNMAAIGKSRVKIIEGP